MSHPTAEEIIQYICENMWVGDSTPGPINLLKDLSKFSTRPGLIEQTTQQVGTKGTIYAAFIKDDGVEIVPFEYVI